MTSPATLTPDVDARTTGARVPAVHNAVAVLRHLSRSPQPISAGALSRTLHIPRSSTYQLLQALIDEGLVLHVPDARGYALGPGVAELGSAYSQRNSLTNIARPALTRLARTVGETAALSILQYGEVLYLEKAQPPRPIALVTDRGVRLPAHLTASGRAMMARLPASEVLAYFSDSALQTLNGEGPTSLRRLRELLAEDLRRGWSMERGCVSEEITCVSAAVLDRTGRPVAAVTVSFLSRKSSAIEWIAEEVIRAADGITRMIGGSVA